jgi:serine/threonine protein kinase
MHYDPNEAKSIFLKAVEISSEAERAAFLDQACAGKPELKARVENLLKTVLDPDSLLDQPVAEFGATHLASPDVPPVSLDFLDPCDVPGRLGRLGGYEILEVIGRGGMGVVLRAMDVKLNRVVAIKVLAPELASNPQARKRFLREAQAAAAVSHDHVVTIYAVDDDEKVPFLVMECIVGQSLQQKIDNAGALGLKEILRIGMQIASGLAAAHKQGLVHRDIKPANVLLENGVERVKITDFGLARATDDVGITQSGQIAGTPQYMSPEQAMGQPVDQRSDLFSLGSVLYAMCTGRPAFRADSAVAVLRRVCDDSPRPIGEVNAEVPDWLIAIVNRLMSKRSEDRFQTAQEVASLFEQWLAQCQQQSAVARTNESPAIALDHSRASSTNIAGTTGERRGVLGRAWDEWWSERDRWVAISVQTVLILVYLACMICFVSFWLSTGHDSDGRVTFDYRLGTPTPWFKFEVFPEPLVPFRTGFHPWSSSVLLGLVGCLAFAVYWRIEKARNPKTSKWGGPAYMLGIWGIGAVLAVGVGHWQGYAALWKPRVTNQPTVPKADDRPVNRDGWLLGPNGPELTDVFAQIVLKLQPAQIEKVNQVLQTIHLESRTLETQQVEQQFDAAGHLVNWIKPYPELIEKLKDRLWTQLDEILDTDQQSIARLNLKLDPPAVQTPIALTELVRPGFFGWGQHGAMLELWRVGTWHHWTIQTRGYESSGNGLQLPDEYRRFAKPTDRTAEPSDRKAAEDSGAMK